MSTIRSPVRSNRGQQRTNNETAKPASAAARERGETVDAGGEEFHTPGKPWPLERDEEAAERRPRGRPTNRDLLARAKGKEGVRTLFGNWRQGGGSTDRGEEGEKNDDSKRSREEEEEEQEEEKKRKKIKQKSPSDKRKEEGYDINSLGEMLKCFREETCKALMEMQKQGAEVREELRKSREKWVEWEKVWLEEKGKVWEKFEDIERKQEKSETERKSEIEKLEERVKKLESTRQETEKKKEKGEGITVAKETEGDRRGSDLTENGRLDARLKEVEKRLERENRAKRTRNLIVKGLRVDSETGEEEIKKLMKDIGVVVQIEEVRGVGPKSEGKLRMYIIKVRTEEEKTEILRKKKALRGRRERIEEDLTWNERRRKWLLEHKARIERVKGNIVRVGKDRLWINGELSIWDEEQEELIKKERKKGEQGEEEVERKEERGEGSEEREKQTRGERGESNAAGFSQERRGKR